MHHCILIEIIRTYFFSQLLQCKFDDFKLRVETGSERFNQCEELAKKLIASDTTYSSKIEQRQQHLR